jgi:hypothetical protein
LLLLLLLLLLRLLLLLSSKHTYPPELNIKTHLQCLHHAADHNHTLHFRATLQSQLPPHVYALAEVRVEM